MSLIYHLIIYSKQFLFMGDLSVNGERKLIQHYPYLKADILKVGITVQALQQVMIF
jgi:beta-lactamase superfamily II metal-dependent hydrolase